jgi:biopolymer transport protein ExbD
MGHLMHRRGPAQIESNLTPMIDVTFLLIVFFVLVSQLVEAEHVDMDLPAPERPLTEPIDDAPRTMINLVPDDEGSISMYRVGPRPFAADAEGVAAMTERLIELYRANPNVELHLRADRATHYRWIEPVMRAISEAARRVGDPELVARVNLVVVREE